MFRHLSPAGPGNAGFAFTDAADGLSLGRADVLGVEAVRRGGRAVLGATGIPRMYAVSQVHGTDVITVDEGILAGWQPDSWLGSAVAGQPSLARADALVTTVPGVALLIRVADCVPVVFIDDAAGAIGVAHAGRVGLAAGVLPATLTALRALGAGDVRAIIGPHICGDCYEVPAEMQRDVAAGLAGAAATTSWNTPALDLGRAAAMQLADLGCTVEQVAGCTREDPGLHSHRRDPDCAGRLGALAWLAA